MMKKPTLSEYGLTERDVLSLQDETRTRTRGLGASGAIVGGLSCVVVSSVLESPTVVLLLATPFWGLLGWGVGIVIAGRIEERDHRSISHSNFKRDLRNYEEWSERTKAQFWLRLTGHSFEHELARLFRYEGYDAVVTPGSGDHGVDIVLRRDGQVTVVQCKHTSAPVGPSAARELYGTLMASGADDAILASLGGVSVGVRTFIQGKPIRVIGLAEILEMQARRGQHLQ
jgi:hypothetical protein